MAARNEPAEGRAWTPQKVRDRIQAALLANRLEDHALGLVEMTGTQLKAAEILLRKTVPDLSSMAHTNANGDGPPELLVTATDVRG